MRRKIGIVLIAVGVALVGALIWRLDIPHWQKLDLNKIYASPQASIVIDSDGNAVGALSGVRTSVWTPIDEIPETLQNAFIAAEDQRFYQHHGISVRRIAAAALNDLRTRSFSQGASTITQQLIKLTHLKSEKTLSRKAQEAFLALRLERKLSKSQILECYLNTVYFGSGAYGVSAAAKAYFGKNLNELTTAECALLAGIIKAPSIYAPHLNPEKSVSRRNHILDEMVECGMLTADEAETAKKEPLALNRESDESRAYGWYMDAVLDEAAKVLSISVDEARSGGYTIQTALDSPIQDFANRLYADESNFPIDASDGTPVESAFVAINPASGEIRAMIGGRSYDVQRGLNRTSGILRSPGSTIKPVSTYIAAIDQCGFAPSSFVDDTPRSFGDYVPGNAGGNSYGLVTLREALSRSLNIATVDLADLIGMERVRSYACAFGLNLDAADCDYALALGSMTYGVSPVQLCGAYAALANGGVLIAPHLIRSIRDSEGRMVYLAQPNAHRAATDWAAYMITDMLKTAASSGSARALSSAGLPVAAKTGTASDSDGSTRDVWTAAYTPDLAIAVWMGFDQPSETHRLSSGEGGSGYPARLCAQLFSGVRDRVSGADFTKPASVKTLLIDSVALEKHSVLLATAETPAEYVRAELFTDSNAPHEYSCEWRAPAAITDLTLVSHSGETPIIQFTSQSESAEYLVLRTTAHASDVVAVLSGTEGEVLSYADQSADPLEYADYAILPRHKLLYEKNVLLTGAESASVRYSPGGLANWFSEKPQDFGSEIEIDATQSIFG